MKSASSELEALIGGVAATLVLEGPPEVANLTPRYREANQPMAICLVGQWGAPLPRRLQLRGTHVVAADLLAGNAVVGDTSHCE